MESMSVRDEARGMISRGVGKTDFDTDSMQELVAVLGNDLHQLLPVEDKPHQLIPWLSCNLRDYFYGPDVLVPQNLYASGTNFYRASNAVLETLVIHRKLSSQKLAVYAIMPGTIETAERSVLKQAGSLHECFTPEYSYALLAFFCEHIEPESQPKTVDVLGSRLHHVGDYNMGEHLGPNYRLYVAGWGMSINTTDLTPYR